MLYLFALSCVTKLVIMLGITPFLRLVRQNTLVLGVTNSDEGAHQQGAARTKD